MNGKHAEKPRNPNNNPIIVVSDEREAVQTLLHRFQFSALPKNVRRIALRNALADLDAYGIVVRRSDSPQERVEALDVQLHREDPKRAQGGAQGASDGFPASGGTVAGEGHRADASLAEPTRPASDMIW